MKRLLDSVIEEHERLMNSNTLQKIGASQMKENSHRELLLKAVEKLEDSDLKFTSVFTPEKIKLRNKNNF